jgi:hypothetical protein
MVWVSVGIPAHAQNVNEWLRQKKTQIRYLTEQIAALQVYIELGQKSYAIYRDGLGLISDRKASEFSLHKNYFVSLSQVNPGIRNSAKVQEMWGWHAAIRLFQQRLRRIELAECSASVQQLFSSLVQSSDEYAQQLQLLTTDGHYQLTDEERWAQLGELYEQFFALFAFAQSRCEEALSYAKVIRQSNSEINIVERLSGVR